MSRHKTAWAVALAETECPILYGGRITVIDAWVCLSGARVHGAALDRRLRSSRRHVHRLLDAAALSLGRPRRVTMYGLHGHERQLCEWARQHRVSIGHGLHGEEARRVGAAVDGLVACIRSARPDSLRSAVRAAADWTAAYQPLPGTSRERESKEERDEQGQDRAVDGRHGRA